MKTIIILIVVALVVFAVWMFFGITGQYKVCESKGLRGIQTGNGVVCVSNKTN